MKDVAIPRVPFVAVSSGFGPAGYDVQLPMQWLHLRPPSGGEFMSRLVFKVGFVELLRMD